MNLIETLEAIRVVGPLAFLLGVPVGYLLRHIEVVQKQEQRR